MPPKRKRAPSSRGAKKAKTTTPRQTVGELRKELQKRISTLPMADLQRLMAFTTSSSMLDSVRVQKNTAIKKKGRKQEIDISVLKPHLLGMPTAILDMICSLLSWTDLCKASSSFKSMQLACDKARKLVSEWEMNYRVTRKMNSQEMTKVILRHPALTKLRVPDKMAPTHLKKVFKAMGKNFLDLHIGSVKNFTQVVEFTGNLHTMSVDLGWRSDASGIRELIMKNPHLQNISITGGSNNLVNGLVEACPPVHTLSFPMTDLMQLRMLSTGCVANLTTLNLTNSRYMYHTGCATIRQPEMRGLGLACPLIESMTIGNATQGAFDECGDVEVFPRLRDFTVKAITSQPSEPLRLTLLQVTTLSITMGHDCAIQSASLPAIQKLSINIKKGEVHGITNLLAGATTALTLNINANSHKSKKERQQGGKETTIIDIISGYTPTDPSTVAPNATSHIDDSQTVASTSSSSSSSTSSSSSFFLPSPSSSSSSASSSSSSSVPPPTVSLENLTTLTLSFGDNVVFPYSEALQLVEACPVVEKVNLSLFKGWRNRDKGSALQSLATLKHAREIKVQIYQASVNMHDFMTRLLKAQSPSPSLTTIDAHYKSSHGYYARIQCTEQPQLTPDQIDVLLKFPKLTDVHRLLPPDLPEMEQKVAALAPLPWATTWLKENSKKEEKKQETDPSPTIAGGLGEEEGGEAGGKEEEENEEKDEEEEEDLEEDEDEC